MNALVSLPSGNIPDLDHAAALLAGENGIVAMYEYMEGFGYQYATLAKQFYAEEGLSAQAALNNLHEVAQESGVSLTDEIKANIKLDMARASLEVYREKFKGGDFSELKHGEVEPFHTVVLDDYGLPPKAWTLHIPLSVMTEREKTIYWETSLDAGEDPGAQAKVAFSITALMASKLGYLTGISPEAEFAKAVAVGVFDMEGTPPPLTAEQKALAAEWWAINVVSLDNFGNMINAIWQEFGDNADDFIDFIDFIQSTVNSGVDALKQRTLEIFGLDLGRMAPSTEFVKVNSDAWYVALDDGKTTLIFQDDVIRLRYGAESDNITVELAISPESAVYLMDLDMAGEHFQSGDLVGFINTTIEQLAQQQTTTREEEDGDRIDSKTGPAEGESEVNDNLASLRYLSDRLALGSVSDRWAPMALGGAITEGMYGDWSQAGALNQALSSIYQQRWNVPTSLIKVMILGYGTQPMRSFGVDSMMPASEPLGIPVGWIPHSAAVIHADYTLQGYAALARGQVQAAAAVFDNVKQDFTVELAEVQQWMSTQRYKTYQGYPNRLLTLGDTALITMYSADNTQFTSAAGKDIVSWIEDSALGDAAIGMAATQEDIAFGLATDANSTAISANFGGQDVDRVTALDTARQAATALGDAVAAYFQAHGQTAALADRLEQLRVELNKLVPVNTSYTGHLPGGAMFHSPGDADFAAATFAAYAKALRHAANSKVILDELLSAFAQLGGYTEVYLGKPGQAVVLPDGFNLLLAGAGENHFTLSAHVDHLLVSASTGNVTLSGFQAGATGDQIQIAGVGDQVELRRVTQGVELTTTVGGKRVVLSGVDINSLDLFANLTGVTTVSFAKDTEAGIRSLRRPLLFDGQVHVNELIASNYGDTLIGGDWNTVLRGGVGNDMLVVTGTGYYMDGGGGIDSVSYAESHYAIYANLTTGTDSRDSTLVDIENLIGSKWDDQLTGDSSGNQLDGGEGDDLLLGNGGNDVYRFGRGHGTDTILNGTSANDGASSLIQLAPDIEVDELWYARQGDDLLIRILGTDDKLVIQDWYQDGFRKVAILELHDGLRIDAAGMELLAETMQGWLISAPGFDPSSSWRLTAEMDADSFYREDLALPEVGEPANIALETQQLLDSGEVLAARDVVSAIIADMALDHQQLADLDAAAIAQAALATPITIGEDQRLYRYTRTDLPGEYISLSFGDWERNAFIFGRPDYVADYVELFGADAGRFYYRETVTSNLGSYGTKTFLEEGAEGQVDALLANNNQLANSLSSFVTTGNHFKDVLETRQSALTAAVEANESSNNSTAAQLAAQDFSRVLSSTLNSYAAYTQRLDDIDGLLDTNQQLLSAIKLPDDYRRTAGTVWYDHSMAFYSDVDRAKFAAFVAVQEQASITYDKALDHTQGLIQALSGMDRFQQVHYAGQGQTIQAGPGGDLLIAGSGDSRRLIGGTGRDTYLFAQPARGSVDEVLGFETGLAADRLWLLQPVGGRASVTQAAGSLTIAYTAAGGRNVQVHLNGVALADMSFYDNLIGVNTIEFSSMAEGVTVNLASLTPRVADGYLHVRDLVGSQHDDYLLGDAQDNLILGGAGNDRIAGGAGNNTLNGGAGIDILDYSQAITRVDVDLAAGTASNGMGGNDRVSGFEDIMGSAHNDSLVGNTADNVLHGGYGNDRLEGGAGDDILIGGVGNDVLVGGVGSDVYHFGRGEGRDRIVERDATAGHRDTVLFGAGITAEQLWLQRVGNDLHLSLLGTTDGLVVENWFMGAQYRVDVFQTVDGKELTAAGAQRLVAAMEAWPVPTGEHGLPADVAAALASVFEENWTAPKPPGVTLEGTSANDTLDGTQGDDILIGKSGNDILNGFEGDDVLDGGAGNDTLFGGAGTNTLIGGAGNDIYHVSSSEDSIIEFADGGGDQVRASVSFVLPEHVEALFLMGEDAINATGNDSQNILMGNAAVNTLSGEGGADILNGFEGDDILLGGTGNDHYVIARGNGMDRVIEDDDTVGNTDTVAFSNGVSASQLWFRRVGDDLEVSIIGTRDGVVITDWYLGERYRVEAFQTSTGGTLAAAQVQVLVQTMVGLTPPAMGQTSLPVHLRSALGSVLATTWQGEVFESLVLVGGAGDDVLEGGPGNDTLVGGAGNNTLVGGFGDDTYVVSSETDVVVEKTNQGRDHVRSSVSFELPEHVEWLTLVGSDAITGIGNAEDNILFGNAASNTLIGGAGSDILQGMAGDDVLIGGTGSDFYLLTPGGGRDRIVETESLEGDVDIATIGATPESLWFRQVGDDLEVSIIGEQDQFLIQDWYQGSEHRIERFQASGKTLLDTQVDNLVSAMAAFAPPASGQTTLPSAYQAALAPVIAANWQ